MGYDTEAEMRQELLLRPLDGKAPGRAQRQLLMDGTAVKSAFALLSTKVTKPMRRIRRGLPPEMGERILIEKNNQLYDRERFCQP